MTYVIKITKNNHDILDRSKDSVTIEDINIGDTEQIQKLLESPHAGNLIPIQIDGIKFRIFLPYRHDTSADTCIITNKIIEGSTIIAAQMDRKYNILFPDLKEWEIKKIMNNIEFSDMFGPVLKNADWA